MQRVGLLGGTFDPPHAAHLALARAALDAGAVDVIWVVPAGDPWQKSTEATADDRLAMTRLAFAAMPQCVVQDLEIRRPGPTYTIDTVRAMQGAGLTVRCLIGSDTLAALPTWHAIEDLAHTTDFLVVSRPGTPVTPPAIPGLQVTVLPTDERTEASRDLRAAIRATGACPDGVDVAVWRYIVDHALYGTGHA